MALTSELDEGAAEDQPFSMIIFGVSPSVRRRVDRPKVRYNCFIGVCQVETSDDSDTPINSKVTNFAS